MKKKEQEIFGYKGFFHDMTTRVRNEKGEKVVTQWKEGQTKCLRGKKAA